MIAEQAPGIPFLWDKAALVQSKDVLGVASRYITTHDLTFTSLKK
jgi:peptide/nickel transport system substrate-binding protein